MVSFSYLLYVLPESAFFIVLTFLVTVYDSPSIPHEWLVSQVFCVVNGKRVCQRPDRWHSITMSYSMSQLLMRLVHHTLYSLFAPLL